MFRPLPQHQLHIVQPLAGHPFPGPGQHHLGVIQRQHPLEAARQRRQEAPLTGADLQRDAAPFAGLPIVRGPIQQLTGLLRVLVVLGDQILMPGQVVRVPGEKRPALGGALRLHAGQPLPGDRVRRRGVEPLEQGALQRPGGGVRRRQAAPVEDRVALPAAFHQAALGQHL